MNPQSTTGSSGGGGGAEGLRPWRATAAEMMMMLAKGGGGASRSPGTVSEIGTIRIACCWPPQEPESSTHHLQRLEVTSPVRRHPRIHGNIRNSSVGLSTQTCSLRAGRWRGFPSQEVRPTSSRHTGVGGIRLFWDSASDGPPSEAGAIPSELFGAESRITPLPCSRSSCSFPQ